MTNIKTFRLANALVTDRSLIDQGPLHVNKCEFNDPFNGGEQFKGEIRNHRIWVAS